MAKNTSKNYPSAPNWNIRFLNRKLTTDEKKTFEVWFSDQDRAALELTRTFHDGYKASVLWMREQEVFNATLFAAKDGEKNVGLAISSKSGDWYKAVCMCIYKHAVIAKGAWELLDVDSDEEG